MAGAGNLPGDAASDPPAEPGAATGTSPARKRGWLGKLATYLASFAGGAAVNDLSGTLGYHGLAGAIALLGVVTDERQRAVVRRD